MASKECRSETERKFQGKESGSEGRLRCKQIELHARVVLFQVSEEILFTRSLLLSTFHRV